MLRRSKLPTKMLFALIAIIVLLTTSLYAKLVNEAEKYDARYWEQIGYEYMSNGEYYKAIEAFSKAIELDPNSYSAYFIRGSLYGQLRRYREALEDFNRAINLNPNNAAAYISRGNVYRNLKQYGLALEDFNRAINLDPNQRVSYAYRGKVYKDLGQYDKAMEDFNKAIAIDFNYSEEIQSGAKYGFNVAWVYKERGETYKFLGQYDKANEDYTQAIELYNKAIELNPNNAILFDNRAQLYYDLGQYDKAIEDCTKAIELNPNYAYAYRRRGDAYKMLKQFDEAIENYNKALELNPNDYSSYKHRGQAYRDLKQYDNAIEDFIKALELNPNDADLYYELERAKGDLKEITRAKINPFAGVFLAALPVAGAIFLNIQDKKRKKPKTAKVIENWKANMVTIAVIMAGLWSLLLFIAFTRMHIGAQHMILKYGGVVATAIFCLITAEVIYKFFISNEISKGFSYITIALSVSCTIFASLIFLDFIYTSYTITQSFILNTMLIALPLSTPSLLNVYFAKRYGEILIVKGKVAKIPTTGSFPVELSRYYTNTEYIGGGGFAYVFRTTRKEDGTKTAVKIPMIKDEKTGKMFLSEVEHWSALENENIVKLCRFNIFPVPYLEMELCDGTLGFGKRNVGEACSIIYEAAKGLKHAHENNLVHGDIKHSNILIKDRKIKISDWGLSKVKRKKSVSLSGITPQYAAPEQISSEFGKADERTDIYQLGVVFYELITGRMPFEGEQSEIYNYILHDQPTPPSELNPDSKCIEHIIMKCLLKRKEERYQSVDELLKELEVFYKLEGETTLTRWDAAKKITMYCTNCGNKIEDGDAYCPYCGIRIGMQ